jgi:membrane protein YdbS with pleckstrin-like domain
MAFPRKLLAPGEDVVLEAHPNWSILVPRTSLFLLVVAGCVAIVVLWGSAPLWFGYVLLGFAGLFFLALLAKILVWRSTTLVLTNRRVVYRTGVFRRLGREIPLDRVQDVTYTQSILERLVGAGSLTIESAGAGGEDPFPDIRRPAVVQSLINRLITAPTPGYGAGGGLGGSGAQQPSYPQPPYQQRGQPQYPEPQYPEPQYPEPQWQQPQYHQPQYPQPQPQYPQPQYPPPAQPQYPQPQPQYPQPQYPPPQPQYPQPQYPQPQHEPPPYQQPAPYQPPAPQSSPPGPSQPLAAPAPAQPQPSRPASKAPPPADDRPSSSSEQLKHLDDLLRLGVITEAEYAQKRRELLQGL